MVHTKASYFPVLLPPEHTEDYTFFLPAARQGHVISSGQKTKSKSLVSLSSYISEKPLHDLFPSLPDLETLYCNWLYLTEYSAISEICKKEKKWHSQPVMSAIILLELF